MKPEPYSDPRFAPHDTLLGQLQRGTGAGALAALAQPADVVEAHVLACLGSGVGGDEWEYAAYLAEVVRRAAARLDGVATRLGELLDPSRLRPRAESARSRAFESATLDFLGFLALRSRRDALELLVDRELWSPRLWPRAQRAALAAASEPNLEALDAMVVLDPPEFEDLSRALFVLRAREPELLQRWGARNPRIARVAAAMPPRPETWGASPVPNASSPATADPLGPDPSWNALVRLGDTDERCRGLRERITAKDVPFLLERLESPHRRESSLAALGLALFPSEVTFDALHGFAELALGSPEPEPGELLLQVEARTWQTEWERARELAIAFRAFAPGAHRELARAWTEAPQERLRVLGWQVLANSDELFDHERAVLSLRERLRRDEIEGEDFQPLFQLLGASPHRRWLAEIEEASERTTDPLRRQAALEALAGIDRARFSVECARACLWDASEMTILLGIEHAPLDQPGVRARLEELRTCPWGCLDNLAKARLER